MKVKRAVRVAELLKREMSEIFATKVRDVAIKYVMLTEVKLSDDLKYAKIYYRLINEQADAKEVASALERVSKFVRLELGKRTSLRYVPELHFFYDSSVDYANRIDYLLHKLKKSQQE